MPRRKYRDDFFTDCELLSGFFIDLDALILQAQKDAAKLARYKARREHNAQKALRLYNRLQIVRNFNPWKQTQYIEEDEFGDHHERFKEVRKLKNKQMMMIWILWAMYHYWMFDQNYPGTKFYGNRYSKYRKLWYKLVDEMEEATATTLRAKRIEETKRKKAKLAKGKKKLSPKETVAILKAKRVVDVIENMEPIQELETLWQPENI